MWISSSQSSTAGAFALRQRAMPTSFRANGEKSKRLVETRFQADALQIVRTNNGQCDASRTYQIPPTLNETIRPAAR